MNLTGFLITALVTAVSLFIISKLPLGVEIDGFGKALVAAVIFGILNALVKPIMVFFGFPFIVVTLGLFLLVINALIFGLAAWLVDGFRLRWGFWSAFLGAIALSLINSLLSSVLVRVFP